MRKSKHIGWKLSTLENVWDFTLGREMGFFPWECSRIGLDICLESDVGISLVFP
jgi:hypothetical protein